MADEDDQPTDNKVTCHEDYIEVVWFGEQTADTVSQSVAQTVEASEKLKAQNKPILLLLRILEHPLTPNMPAFKEVLNVFRRVSFNRLAVSGNLPPSIMYL